MDLRNSYLLVPLSMIVFIIIVQIEAYLSGKKSKEYLKHSVLVGIVVAVMIYINTNSVKINEEIIHGNPPF